VFIRKGTRAFSRAFFVVSKSGIGPGGKPAIGASPVKASSTVCAEQRIPNRVLASRSGKAAHAHDPRLCNVSRRARLSNGMRLDLAQSDSPDEVLIREVMSGSERAFRRLYRRHTPRLRVMVLRLVGYDDADADDIVQDTWLACCRGLRAFRGDAQFGTWLTRIGIRAARRRMAHALDEPTSLDTTDAAVAATDAPSMDAAIDAERALRRLGDRDRIVFTLHYLEGLSHDEIARELGIATGTSRAILSRALTALRAHYGTEVP